MRTKIISSLTLVSFLIFIMSCTVRTTKKLRVKSEADLTGKKFQVLGVLKKSGEKIEFPKNRPGRIYEDAIIGTEIEIEEVIIDRDNIAHISAKDEKITEVVTKDGLTYYVIRVISEEEDRIIIETSVASISIPFSEVEMVWIKKVSPAGTFFATIGGIALVFVGIGAIIALTKESCPFIYSFDGEKYVFDAEPYGGATCQGLERTEWCGLEHLKEVNGQYKIMITNEVDETQYTDELKLLVFDHPKGVNVVPDESGDIHTISHPIIPIQANDQKGRNLMPFISENDWLFWQTQTEDKNPDDKEGLKDELIFEFPKPVGITKAKLLFNGCNTLWASQMLKRYLELYGSKVHECYEKMNSFGPAYYMVMNWNMREELYLLQIRVETENGWKSKGAILGGGPFISEDKVYNLDLSDVQGEILKIKLTPPAAFWMINYLAIDYTEDLPISVIEIEPLDAVDNRGEDVREILSKNDNNYLVMPNIGDSAELVFQSRAQNIEMERSVILKATGFYDIHLEAKGEPQRKILERFLTEPGFTIQYAFKEYLKWKKEIMEKSALHD